MCQILGQLTGRANGERIRQFGCANKIRAELFWNTVLGHYTSTLQKV